MIVEINIRLLAIALATVSTLALTAAEFPKLYNTEPEGSLPMPAEQAAATAKLPTGFRLDLFAAEPMVQQPIAIDFDESGRLWVAECYTFAERPLRWDLNLRDRITILEDTNNDGKADKRTIFWDQGTRLTSVAVGLGGVYVLCAPNLFFIPDKNNDLIPDSEPIVILEGFNAEHIGHNIVNGLKWGPDGWLYGRHGITASSLVGKPNTPESEKTALNCSIWRYQPSTETFEVFCNGGTNPWGMDWDQNGQLFYTNTVIGHLWHAIPGAYYKRMFGAHLNKNTYEVIQQTADHYHWDTGKENWNDSRKGISSSTDDLGGGHAHMGCLIYQGGVWPKEYHGKLFTSNLHGRRINMEHLERLGTGYVAKHAPDFLKMEDPWFRALDLVTGPDGQVWINDWSDTGECHDNDGIHRTSGRIYKIVYQGPEAGQPKQPQPKWLYTDPGTPIHLDRIENLLKSKDEAQVAMGIRWLTEQQNPNTLQRLLPFAKNQPLGLVRLELAAALQRLPSKDRFQLASILCQIEEDATDRQQPLMIWYGICDTANQHPNESIQLALQSKLPTVTQLITRHLAGQIDTNPEFIDTLLSQSTEANRQSILNWSQRRSLRLEPSTKA